MDKADADFLQHLFKENNNLRGTVTGLRRQLHNTTTALEETEIELRNLKIKTEELKDKSNATGLLPVAPQAHRAVSDDKTATHVSAGSKETGGKDYGELKFIAERQDAEITQLSEELAKIRGLYNTELEKNNSLEKDMTSVMSELESLRIFKEKAIEEKEDLLRREAEIEPSFDQEELKKLLKQAQARCDEYRIQLLDFANEANQTQNAQQNQLQGVEAMMESIRDEYEEFITITRNENEAFQSRQKSEYNTLKQEFEQYTNRTFEEKKRTMMEYQNILTTMQAQFDEYRTTTEMMFNIEMVKLEEEISSQASRYEQEIMYIIQAKDKFYMDMMITKDAKIMGLIEGSDLQSLMQKHELDMENLRKEHAKDVERVKSEHESESKNVMLLLQRQNVSLESKTEKLQSHLKTMETRMKELMNTIDVKNKTIAERDELRAKIEAENQKKTEEMGEKITKIIQEKERLRHKVIRLNLHAKGEGENSIENMIKRLSNDTTVLKADFDQLGTSYTRSLSENQELLKKLREKEKLCVFLEKELERRGQEFKDMTSTFEGFLAGRAKQARHDRNQKLLRYVAEKEKTKVENSTTPQFGLTKAVVKSVVPDRGHDLKSSEIKNASVLDRGYVYLKRFKNLSKAFASGDFRPLANIEQQDGPSGPWQKTPLYAKLEDTSVALAKLYNLNENAPKEKSQIYTYHSNNAAPGSKIYSETPSIVNKGPVNPKIPRPESSFQKNSSHGPRSGAKGDSKQLPSDLLSIGGKHVQ